MMGRPIKVDGNPKHPASLGAIDVFAQAQLLEFYDPDRASQINARGEPTDQQRLQSALDTERVALAAKHGEGLRILTGTVTSPTLARQLEALRINTPRRSGSNGSRSVATRCGKGRASLMERRWSSSHT